MDYGIIIKPRGKDEYENQPVYWCKRCSSLRVIDGSRETGSIDHTVIQAYCGKCGSTSITMGSMDDWIDFKEEYERKLLEEGRDSSRKMEEFDREVRSEHEKLFGKPRKRTKDNVDIHELEREPMKEEVDKRGKKKFRSALEKWTL